jgi:hypothetical protein
MPDTVSSSAVVRASRPLWCGRSFTPLRTGSACELRHGHLGRESARAGCPCHSGRDARTTSHAATPSAACPLFSITFSLCSGDFEVSLAFCSAGLFLSASSPTRLLSAAERRSTLAERCSTPAERCSALRSRPFVSAPGGLAASLASGGDLAGANGVADCLLLVRTERDGHR